MAPQLNIVPARARFAFDPGQPRDAKGMWSAGATYDQVMKGARASGMKPSAAISKVSDAGKRNPALKETVRLFTRVGDGGDEGMAQLTGTQKDLVKELIRTGPKYAGEEFRGVLSSQGKINELQNSVGRDMKLRGVQSFSRDPKIAVEFMNRVYDESGFGRRIIYHLRGRGGVPIEGLSSQQREREVIHGPGSKFRITQVYRTGGRGGESVTHVRLVEH